MGSHNPGRAETWIDGMRLALALSSYLLLHELAMRPRVLVTDPSQFGPALPGLLLGYLAQSLEFVVPVLLLCGGALVRRARSFLQPAAPVPACAAQGMSGFEFEYLTRGGLRLPRRARVVPARAALRALPDRLAA
jgi:restriction system protein